MRGHQPIVPKESNVKRFLAHAIAVTMLLGVLGAAPAQAHERTASTRLTISANKTRVDKGRKVRFSGSLKSDWKRCRAYKTVKLVRGHTVVQSKKTTRAGLYSFTRKIRKTKTWRVKFSGKKWGTHPHVHRCLASSSRGIQVRVRG
jgi:hypothetical protein